jgi:hypothetical protein
MSLPAANLNSLIKADLVPLTENGVTESPSLEFKSEMYANRDADKKELLKDFESDRERRAKAPLVIYRSGVLELCSV